MFYRSKDEYNVWLSTFHEALHSPYTAAFPQAWNRRVIEFARECADEALKEYQDKDIGGDYHERDV